MFKWSHCKARTLQSNCQVKSFYLILNSYLFLFCESTLNLVPSGKFLTHPGNKYINFFSVCTGNIALGHRTNLTSSVSTQTLDNKSRCRSKKNYINMKKYMATILNFIKILVSRNIALKFLDVSWFWKTFLGPRIYIICRTTLLQLNLCFGSNKHYCIHHHWTFLVILGKLFMRAIFWEWNEINIKKLFPLTKTLYTYFKARKTCF